MPKEIDTPEVSLFKNGKSPQNPESKNFFEIYQETQTGVHKGQVELVKRLKKAFENATPGERAAKEKEWKEAKVMLPCFTASGTFSQRNNKSLLTHSGIIQGDIDGKDNLDKSLKEMRAVVTTDPTVIAHWVSPSGDGIKFFSRTSSDPAKQAGSFFAIEKYYADQGIVIDKQCKDVSRACFVSYDPEAVFRPYEETQEVVFTALVASESGLEYEKKTKKYSMDVALTALEAISDHHGDLDYDHWLRLSSGMFNSYGENGIRSMEKIFPDIASGYLDRKGKWLKDISAGTIIYLARKIGWRGDVSVVDRFFYEGKKGYHFESSELRYISQNATDLERRLRKAGFTGDNLGDQVDHIQETRDIAFAGEVSGKLAGFYDEGGTRFLVTKSPTFITPVRGEWPTIKAIIEGLLVKHEDAAHGRAQLDTFYGWLKTSVISLRDGDEQDGQALVLIGGVDSGKTFLQNYFITPCLGGRSAKASQFMQGGTAFNSDLFKAEHLVLSDEHMSRKMESREQLAANIKKFTVSTHGERVHAKGVDAFTITPWWRISISLNTEPANLLILPPLTGYDVEDKILILRASKEPFPMPTNTSAEKKRLREKIAEEMPGFLYWLLNDFTIPAKRVCGRFGVTTWHNPEIVKLIQHESEEANLLTLIDAQFWPYNNDDYEKDFGPSDPFLKWEGTATQLKDTLCMSGINTATRSAERLLGSFPNKPGTLLGNLKEIHKDRFSLRKRDGFNIWTIYPPSDHKDLT